MKDSKKLPDPGEKKNLKDKKNIEPKKQQAKEKQVDGNEKITNGNSKDEYFVNPDDPKPLN